MTTSGTDTSTLHYWHPIPADGRRHAFRGGRRWDGRTAEMTVCGAEVAMVAVSEMDWIYRPTCGFCWQHLIDDQRERDRAAGRK